jgi:hypothetical protein
LAVRLKQAQRADVPMPPVFGSGSSGFAGSVAVILTPSPFFEMGLLAYGRIHCRHHPGTTHWV